MNHLPIIDLGPATGDDHTTMHPADLRMWFAVGVACCFTLGFVVGVTFHIWVR